MNLYATIPITTDAFSLKFLKHCFTPILIVPYQMINLT